MDVVKMLSRQNDQKYKISEKYSVGFYTLRHMLYFGTTKKENMGSGK